jgi:hypothetical protein
MEEHFSPYRFKFDLYQYGEILVFSTTSAFPMYSRPKVIEVHTLFSLFPEMSSYSSDEMDFKSDGIS